MNAIKLPVEEYRNTVDLWNVRDANNVRLCRDITEDQAKQIAHALNLHDELRKSARRFFNAQAAVDRLRITSCGKTLEVAEAEFTEAQLDLAEVLYRAENATAT